MPFFLGEIHQKSAVISNLNRTIYIRLLVQNGAAVIKCKIYRIYMHLTSQLLYGKYYSIVSGFYTLGVLFMIAFIKLLLPNAPQQKNNVATKANKQPSMSTELLIYNGVFEYFKYEQIICWQASANSK